MLRRVIATGFCLAFCAAGAAFAGAATPLPAISASPAAAPAMTPAAAAAAITSNATLPQFDVDTAAQKHCPADKVVWLNLNNNIYFNGDSRWYGHTKHGAYVCQKEANSAGDRETNYTGTEHRAQW